MLCTYTDRVSARYLLVPFPFAKTSHGVETTSPAGAQPPLPAHRFPVMLNVLSCGRNGMKSVPLGLHTRLGVEFAVLFSAAF